MTRSFFAAAAAVLVLASSQASSQAAAQGRWVAGRPDVRNHGDLPRGQRPPYGLCQIWVDGVAPGPQSNVTGCAYAYSNVPRNGRVVYGGERGELFGSRYDPYYYGRQIRERDRRYDRYRDDNRYYKDDRYRDDRYRDDRYRDDRYRDDRYRDDRYHDDRYHDDYYCDDSRSRYQTGLRGRDVDRYREHDRGYDRANESRKNEARGRGGWNGRGGFSNVGHGR